MFVEVLADDGGRRGRGRYYSPEAHGEDVIGCIAVLGASQVRDGKANRQSWVARAVGGGKCEVVGVVGRGQARARRATPRIRCPRLASLQRNFPHSAISQCNAFTSAFHSTQARCHRRSVQMLDHRQTERREGENKCIARYYDYKVRELYRSTYNAGGTKGKRPM